MYINIVLFAAILIVVFLAGWLVRSYMSRLEKDKMAKIDASFKAVGQRAESAYDSARDSVKKRID